MKHINIFVDKLNGGMKALCDLKKEKQIHDISIGSNNVEATLYLLNQVGNNNIFEYDFDSLLIANSWNLLDHPNETIELFEMCRKRKIKITVAGLLLFLKNIICI